MFKHLYPIVIVALIWLLVGTAYGKPIPQGSENPLDERGFSLVIQHIFQTYPEFIRASYFFTEGIKEVEKIIPDMRVIKKKEGFEIEMKGERSFFTYPADNRDTEAWSRWCYDIITFIHHRSGQPHRNTIEVAVLDTLIKFLDWKSGFFHHGDDVEQEDGEDQPNRNYGIQFSVFRNRVFVSDLVDELQNKNIRVGDQVLAVNGTKINPNNFNEILAEALEETKLVTLSLRTSEQGNEQEFSLKDNYTPPPHIERTVLKPGVLVIRMRAFQQDTHEYLKSILNAGTEDYKGIVLDLRGNTGGYLNIVTSIANYFLRHSVIYYQEGQNQKIIKKVEADDSVYTQRPLVVLIDKFTSSGAEVLAAALKDNAGATLVGSRSNGYGLVHTVVPFRNGNFIKLVTSRLLTPNKRAISSGLNPDYCTNKLAGKKAREVKLESLKESFCSPKVSRGKTDVDVAIRVLTESQKP